MTRQALKPKLAKLLADVELIGANLSKVGKSKAGTSSDESDEGVSADKAVEDSEVRACLNLIRHCLFFSGM